MSLDLNMDLSLQSLRGLLSGGKRFVLSIGDEAVVLTLLSRGKVVNAWVAAPDPEEGADDILAALAEVKRAPVAVLMDAFEQVFREEKVPRVGLLDQSKVINRHLQMAFPGNNLQAAMPHGQDPQGNRFYLFASVPPTEQVKGWLEVLRQSGRPPAGIHMLPLESLDMLKALTPQQAIHGVRWRMLFTFNMTGGLRQIVAKQSRIMLTRLTPPPPPDSNIAPVDIIERDFQQTLSYVKRMGYQKGDHLDVVVLAEEPLASDLRGRDWEVHSLTVLSPHEAGEPLGLGRVGQPGSPYADVLHAAFLGAKAKPMVSLHWAHAPRVDLRQHLIAGAPLAMLLASAAMAWQMGSVGLAKLETFEQIEREKVMLDNARQALAREQARLATLEHKPEDVRRVISVLERVTRGDVAPTPLFARLNAAFAGQGVITGLSLRPAQPAPQEDRRRRRQEEAPTGYVLEIQARLPRSVASDAAAVQQAETLRAALAGQFGGDKVTLSRPPVEIGGDQVLRGARGVSADGEGDARGEGEPYTVAYTIQLEGAA